jgi:hypothetical protein
VNGPITLAVAAALALVSAQIPPERLQCHSAVRPRIDAAPMGIEWQQVISLGDARTAYEAYVDRIAAREWELQKYLRDLESKHKQCVTNMEWLNNFFARLHH